MLWEGKRARGERGGARCAPPGEGGINKHGRQEIFLTNRTGQSVSQSLPHSYQRSTWSTYTRSVLDECVVESQTERAKPGGKGALAYNPACQIFFILPRRVVCASVRSDARRWWRWCAPPQHAGGAPRDGTWAREGAGRRGRGRLAKRRRRLAALQHRSPARAIGGELRPPRVVEVKRNR